MGLLGPQASYTSLFDPVTFIELDTLSNERTDPLAVAFNLPCACHVLRRRL